MRNAQHPYQPRNARSFSGEGHAQIDHPKLVADAVREAARRLSYRTREIPWVHSPKPKANNP